MEKIPRGTSGRPAAEVAREVALKAGETLYTRFNKVKRVTRKGRGNIFTDVDVEVQELMGSILKREYPDMEVLGEETPGGRADSGYVWVVDPLDGTFNYAAGIPFFSLVVGLALDGEVLVGINYDPMRQEMFLAEKGRGAFLNDTRIRVSSKSRIEDCLVGLDLSYYDEGAANTLEVIRALWPGVQTARIMGSAALGISYAAAGRTDLYFHHHLEPWDQVAGILLMEEAGGVVTDRKGKRAGLHSDGTIASNPALHAEFMRKTEGLAWRMPTHRLA